MYYFCFFRTEKHFTVRIPLRPSSSQLLPASSLPVASSFQLLPPSIGTSTVFFGTPAVMLYRGPRQNPPIRIFFFVPHAVMLLCIAPSSKNLHRGGGFIHSFIFNSFIVRGQGGTGRKREELQNRDGKMFLLRVLAYSCPQSNLYCILYLPQPPTASQTTK